ncbi:YppE family protein [Bacillus sp. JCM 19034]|uniref:YppE family protein n=1 Tax=Bacillus sp. JCM 19034 TaxID=1481928 RepID=UPI0007821C92|nr:YppE family protein [Bacillus sp. JCM 19034]
MIKQSKLIELEALTNTLQNLNTEAEDFFVEVAKKDGYEVDFYNHVKPFADHVKYVREKWLPLAIEFVQHAKPLHLHPVQLSQTEENLEIVAIKSFYSNTSRKRQMETFKSVSYVLTQLKLAIDQYKKRVNKTSLSFYMYSF